ncbi:peroxiredoxin [Halioxenophilus aromaticivorans]|uniref:thioredoxin-dependent peroxiredoxin n=1 Tax=Halioxenophilus aromaticivorans TaxID=1306992 RepID=A0AAV3U4J7_9ALTE
MSYWQTKKAKLAAIVALLATAVTANAALESGTQAPMFQLTGALAGEAFDFDLQQQLKQGPVVVYFYPKAFTAGCTIEAHEFAEASDDFTQLGARVVGVSTDEIDTLKEFSVSDCRDKFAVLADPSAKVVEQYDAFLPNRKLADRISYVVVPSGEIIYVHHTMEPKSHIAESLRAIKQWQADQ